MKRTPKAKKPDLSDPRIIDAAFKAAGIQVPVREYRITETRRFRWDYAWPEYRVALEQQGGVWSRGAHGRGTGIVRDQEKANLAAMHGWLCLYCQPRDLLKRETMEAIARTLGTASSVERIRGLPTSREEQDKLITSLTI